jgi:GST-like protein
MYTLYGSKGSGSAAIEFALERCNAPFKLVRASSWEPDSALALLERINALKQIPTLVLPDGAVMSESAAILIHLGLAFPDSRLLPTDSNHRAQALRGLVYIAANCYAAVSVSDYPQRWCSSLDETTIEGVRKAARAQLHHHWEIFADLFPVTPASPFFSGKQPGALDVHTAVVSKWSGTRAHLKITRPQFIGTLHAIEKHPEVASVFFRHWDA